MFALKTISIATYLIFGVQCNKLLNSPNILFIIADDLRPALGIYGVKNAYTPNIDTLAKKSIIFSKAYTQQALCAPSRNSFLTSRRPDTLQLYDFYNYWRDQVGNFTTLPQYFKSNGYNTFSIGKVFHPGESSNNTDDYPYSWSVPPFHPSTEIYKEFPVCPDRLSYKRNLICPVQVEFQPEQTLPDLQILDEAVRIIQNEQNSVDPYFLAVGFHKPHIPLKYPRKYLDFHPIENITIDYNTGIPHDLPSVAWNPWNDVRRRDDIASLKLNYPYAQMPMEWTKKIVQSYNAAVSYIDDLIGQLLKQVDENTIIILTSDHGWSLGEHGEWSKFSNFDVSTRVPLILHIPKTNAKAIGEPVELLDLFPTLVDIANLPKIPTCSLKLQDPCTEGVSLKPLIDNDGPEYLKYAFSQYPRPGNYSTKKPDSDKPVLKEIQIMGYSVMGNNFRYTEWVEFNNKNFQKNWNQVYGRELYSHDIDPGENINLVNREDLNMMQKEMQLILRTKFRNTI